MLVVGVVSAVAGDNLGYWVGRRFGQNALPRYARWVLGHPERLSTMADVRRRRGPFAVFVARFVPGIRFIAGPLAGGLGMRFTHSSSPTWLGAVVYVPTVVGAGYAIGYGLGEYVERLRNVVGEVGADRPGRRARRRAGAHRLAHRPRHGRRRDGESRG